MKLLLRKCLGLGRGVTLEAEAGMPLWVWGQPGLYSEFLDSQGYLVRPCHELWEIKIQIFKSPSHLILLHCLGGHSSSLDFSWQSVMYKCLTSKMTSHSIFFRGFLFLFFHFSVVCLFCFLETSCNCVGVLAWSSVCRLTLNLWTVLPLPPICWDFRVPPPETTRNIFKFTLNVIPNVNKAAGPLTQPPRCLTHCLSWTFYRDPRWTLPGQGLSASLMCGTELKLPHPFLFSGLCCFVLLQGPEGNQILQTQSPCQWSATKQNKQLSCLA